MKKIFLSLCFFFQPVYGAFSGHFAEPCYVCPSLFSFPSGYVYDDITDKKLTVIDPDSQAPTFNNLQLKSNFGLFSFCLIRRIEFYALLGKTTAHIDWEDDLPFDDKTSAHFSWQAGVRGYLFSINPFCLGFSASYFAVPNLKEDTGLQDWVEIDLSYPRSFKLKEWQATIGIFVPISVAIPYVGVQYLDSRFDLYTKDPSLHIKYKNKNKIGLVVGACLNLGQSFFLSAEKRFYSEEAVSASCAFVF